MQAYLSHSTLKSHQIYDWCETFTNKGINHQNNYNMNYFLPGNYQRCYVSTCWEMLKCISTILRMNLLLDISLHSMNLFHLIPLQIISRSQFTGNLENHFMLNNYRGPSIAYSIFGGHGWTHSLQCRLNMVFQCIVRSMRHRVQIWRQSEHMHFTS